MFFSNQDPDSSDSDTSGSPPSPTIDHVPETVLSWLAVLFQLLTKPARSYVPKLRSTLRARVSEFKETRKANLELTKYQAIVDKHIHAIRKQWKATLTVNNLDKAAFVGGSMVIFLSGLMLGGCPEWFHVWYSVLLVVMMVHRFRTYYRKTYHYFLADLCYFVNFLILLSIWVLPANEPLIIGAFALAFGNNAVAIALWTNSLVYHSVDKVTSLFIHIMPCATLHSIFHLIPDELRRERFPAVAAVVAREGSYPIKTMMAYSSFFYVVWQLGYYVCITLYRREKIRKGRTTSFTYLRKLYLETIPGQWLNQFSLRNQELIFMCAQCLYALVTMLPAPIWIRYRVFSAVYLLVFFTLSAYNGSVYYMDKFADECTRKINQLQRQIEEDMSPSDDDRSDSEPESGPKLHRRGDHSAAPGVEQSLARSEPAGKLGGSDSRD